MPNEGKSAEDKGLPPNGGAESQPAQAADPAPAHQQALAAAAAAQGGEAGAPAPAQQAVPGGEAGTPAPIPQQAAPTVAAPTPVAQATPGGAAPATIPQQAAPTVAAPTPVAQTAPGGAAPAPVPQQAAPTVAAPTPVAPATPGGAAPASIAPAGVATLVPAQQATEVTLRAVLEIEPGETGGDKHRADYLKRAFAQSNLDWSVYTVQDCQLVASRKIGTSGIGSHSDPTYVFSIDPGDQTSWAFGASQSVQVGGRKAKNSISTPVVAGQIRRSCEIVFRYSLLRGGIRVSTVLCLGAAGTIPFSDVELSVIDQNKTVKRAITGAPNVAEFKNLEPGIYLVKVTAFPPFFPAARGSQDSAQREAQRIKCVQAEWPVNVCDETTELCLCFETCKETETPREITGEFTQGPCDEPLAEGTVVEIIPLNASGSVSPVKLDAQGRFKASLTQGEYALITHAQLPGYTEPQVIQQTIEVGKNTPSDLGTMKLVGPYEISGVVLTPGGNAVADLPVKLLDSNKRLVGVTRTDKEGNYSIPCGAGSFEVLVGAKSLPVSVPKD